MYRKRAEEILKIKDTKYRQEQFIKLLSEKHDSTEESEVTSILKMMGYTVEYMNSVNNDYYLAYKLEKQGWRLDSRCCDFIVKNNEIIRIREINSRETSNNFKFFLADTDEIYILLKTVLENIKDIDLTYFRYELGIYNIPLDDYTKASKISSIINDNNTDMYRLGHISMDDDDVLVAVNNRSLFLINDYTLVSVGGKLKKIVLTLSNSIYIIYDNKLYKIHVDSKIIDNIESFTKLAYQYYDSANNIYVLGNVVVDIENKTAFVLTKLDIDELNDSWVMRHNVSIEYNTKIEFKLSLLEKTFKTSNVIRDYQFDMSDVVKYHLEYELIEVDPSIYNSNILNVFK